MNNKRIAIETMWEDYLKSIGETLENTHKAFDAWHFGSDEKMANQLAELVLEGKKSGTTSLNCLYRLENSALPEIGDHNIILDFNNLPKCIIKVTNVEILPFKDVGPLFAASEGEGDLSLTYWRRVHKKFFENELLDFKKTFREDMLVVCESFKVVYKY